VGGERAAPAGQQDGPGQRRKVALSCASRARRSKAGQPFAASATARLPRAARSFFSLCKTKRPASHRDCDVCCEADRAAGRESTPTKRRRGTDRRRPRARAPGRDLRRASGRGKAGAGRREESTRELVHAATTRQLVGSATFAGSAANCAPGATSRQAGCRRDDATKRRRPKAAPGATQHKALCDSARPSSDRQTPPARIQESERGASINQ